MSIECRLVDYGNPKQISALINLLDNYARDPAGGGHALEKAVIEKLPQALAKQTGAASFLAYINDTPVGFANCFEGFSTFKAKPILNIHDLAVLENHRGAGIATALLRTIENYAIENDCCKLTLEVLDKNISAVKAYEKFGFAGYQLDPKFGQAIFMEKPVER